MVGTNYHDRWVFLFGFGKNERDNITANELAVLQEIAKDLLALTDRQIEVAIENGELLEMNHDHQA